MEKPRRRGGARGWRREILVDQNHIQVISSISSGWANCSGSSLPQTWQRISVTLPSSHSKV